MHSVQTSSDSCATDDIENKILRCPKRNMQFTSQYTTKSGWMVLYVHEYHIKMYAVHISDLYRIWSLNYVHCFLFEMIEYCQLNIDKNFCRWF